MKTKYCSVFVLAVLMLKMAFGAEVFQSERSEIFDNPFIATGVDKKTNYLTGYLSGLRTAPGRTDECKFAFSGQIEKNNSAVIFIKDAVRTENKIEPSVATKGKMTIKNKRKIIVIEKNGLPGNCDLVLSFIGDPVISEANNVLSINFNGGEGGEWQAVHVVAANRAYFYSEPNALTMGKAFLVAGDLIYVYDEKPGWYYVKFQGRKKETVGWIKQSDTIQFEK